MTTLTTDFYLSLLTDTLSKLNNNGTQSSIRATLKKLCLKLEIDRCLIISNDKQQESTVIAKWHRQSRPKTEGSDKTIFNVLSAYLSSDISMAVIDVNCESQFSKDERDRALSLGYRAFVIIPLRYDNTINGYVIAAKAKEPRCWIQQECSIIRLIGETVLSQWLKKSLINDLKASRQQYQDALDASDAILWDWDMQSHEMYFGDQFYKVTGYEKTADTVTIDWFMEIIHPDDKGWITQAIKESFITKRNSDVLEFRIMSRTGVPIWVLSRGNIVARDRQGMPLRSVGTYTDITVFKKTLQALELSQHHAEKNSVAKSEFLARMSHEVRTPLNAITGLLHLLRGEDLRGSQLNKIDLMSGACQQLLSVVNAVLDFSKIESGKMELDIRPFSLDAVIRSIFRPVMAMAEKKGLDVFIDISADIPDKLMGDSNRLGQVLSNLLSNAIKFTHTGYIVLTAKVKRMTGGYITIDFTLSDTGMGMKKEETEILFNPYIQAERSISRQFGGSGLGLAICKSLVELMGGNIYVQSKKGKGSQFYFTIAMQPVVGQTDKKQPEKMDYLQLYCPDNVAAGFYQTLFQALAHKVIVASNRDELINNSTSGHVTVIVDDISLAELEGILTHRNRKIEPKSTVFMLSGSLEADYKALLKRHHHLQVLHKPLTLYQFRKALTARQNNQTRRYRHSTVTKLTEQQIAWLREIKVLLVEDNEVNKLIAREILTGVGVKVDTVAQGKLAVERIQSLGTGYYHVVLMDIEMPVMNGYVATQLIRQLPNGMDLPIVAMTANVLNTDIERSKAFGMNHHIPKPINPDSLIKSIMVLSKGH